MAGWKGDLIGLFGIPSGHDDAAARRVVGNGVQDTLDLIHAIVLPASVGALSRTKVPPLVPVDGAQISFLTPEASGLFGRRPLIPDPHFLLLERLHTRVPMQEPQKLVDDGSQVELLRGQEGKPSGDRSASGDQTPKRACSRAVFSRFSIGQDVVEQFKVGLLGETRDEVSSGEKCISSC